MKILWIIAAAAVLLAAAVLFAGYVAFCMAVHRKKGEITPETYLEKPNHFWKTHMGILKSALSACEDLHYTDAWTTSFDGLRLYGRYYACGKKDRLIILFHGYRSMSRVDFGAVIEKFLEMEYNVLLVDQRAHGKSQGKYICFGAVERYDCAAWAEYADKTYAPGSIILEGISMGGATVLMASSLPLPKSVRGIIADCAFTSPREIIADVARKTYHVPEHPAVDLVGWYCRKLAKFEIDFSVTDALKDSRLPVLMIHGTADGFVPCVMTKRAYDAYSGEKQLVLVEGADHGMSYVKDPARVTAALEEFLGKHAG